MRSLIVLTVLFAIASTAHAEPAVGGTLRAGQAVGAGDGARAGFDIDLMRNGRWSYGGTLTAEYGAYVGGYSCDEMHAPGTVVPSIAQLCSQPTVSGLAALARNLSLAETWQLQLTLGVGATAAWSPQSGGELELGMHPAALARAAILTHLNGDWWVGVRVAEHVYGLSDRRSSLSVGLSVEARVSD